MRLKTRTSYNSDDVFVKDGGRLWYVLVSGVTDKGFVAEVKFLFEEKESACNYADMLRKGKDK